MDLAALSALFDLARSKGVTNFDGAIGKERVSFQLAHPFGASAQPVTQTARLRPGELPAEGPVDAADIVLSSIAPPTVSEDAA